MFIQVIDGKVGDAERFARQMDRWLEDVKPGATGYLGSTGGVTPDGRAIVLARFESEESARANSDRPEQGEWWSETAEAFDGEVNFHDCRDVDLFMGGGSDDAGFVQVIQARAKDEQQMRSQVAEIESMVRESRPDVLGMTVAWHGDGSFTQAVYFASEEEARQGEAGREGERDQDDYMEMLEGQPTFFDLPDPRID